jgi:mannose-1-phosphate guanylyltransferase
VDTGFDRRGNQGLVPLLGGYRSVVNNVRALLLAAGLGSRLRPLTKACPKCLMPIGGKPLLEHWLCNLHRCGISSVLVNSHHHHEMVRAFLSREIFSHWVNNVTEGELLGTAGTLRANADKFLDRTVFLIHADNWCQCNLKDFLEFHLHRRPRSTVMTMMTFRTATPKSCGILETDNDGVVEGFYEKVDEPPGNLANGAVYLLEPEVISWIARRTDVTDFSTDVIPEFLGRIASWENTGIHRDIGTVESLLDAQHDPYPRDCWPEKDSWMCNYLKHPIHKSLSEAMTV